MRVFCKNCEHHKVVELDEHLCFVNEKRAIECRKKNNDCKCKDFKEKE